MESCIDYTLRWTCTIALLVLPCINALINSYAQMLIIRIGISLKAMASDAIYRKALRLTSSAKGTTSTGQLVNIMSTDTNILLQFMMIVSILVMIPVMV